MSVGLCACSCACAFVKGLCMYHVPVRVCVALCANPLVAHVLDCLLLCCVGCGRQVSTTVLRYCLASVWVRMWPD